MSVLTPSTLSVSCVSLRLWICKSWGSGWDNGFDCVILLLKPASLCLMHILIYLVRILLLEINFSFLSFLIKKLRPQKKKDLSRSFGLEYDFLLVMESRTRRVSSRLKSSSTQFCENLLLTI